MPKKTKKLLATIIFAVFAMGIFGALSATNLGISWQEKLQSNLYRERPVSDDIVIVYIDDYSLSEQGLGRWQDWTRAYYATVINNLATAKVIGLDILFSSKSEGISEPDLIKALTENSTANSMVTELTSYLETTHPDDLELANAIEEAGNVILVKFPYYDENGELLGEAGSLDILTSVSLAGGYATSEMPESETIFKLDGGFAKTIARHFTGQEFEIETPMYINYAGSPGAYKYYSFADIYSGNFNPEDIKDKIILIGTGSPTLQDWYLTPLSNGIQMYGVEIHANAIQTILDEDFLTDANSFPTLTILIAIAVVAFMYLNIWGGLASFVGLAIAYWLYAEFAFKKGLILDLVYPFLALATLYLSTTLYRYFTEMQDRKKLKSAFGHYVSREVVEEIAKNPEAIKLGGGQREVTAFFADIANFTTWSEGSKPQELVAQLNEYFTAMSEIIIRNQGTVDKFEGDAIMAFWGAPLPLANHAQLACKTALECRYALEDLNQKWDKKINIRIGINSGLAIIGNIGSKERFDYTAIGDNINLAARLEGANKFYATQIMLSENTHILLGEIFETRRLDRIRVKGKSEPIDIFELLADKGKLPEKTLTLLSEFHQAIEYYRNGKFTEAKERFEKLLTEVAHDGPTETYIKRLEELIANPPQGWDGIWTFDSK